MSKPDRGAKQRAQEYKEQQQEAVELDKQRQAERPKHHNDRDYIDLVGQRIEEAMRAGAFDNLRGKGKPLNLQRNPYVPEEMEMAYAIMKNNNITPEWIGDRNAVLRRVAAFRQEVKQAVAQRHAALRHTGDAGQRAQLAQEWLAKLAELEAQLGEVNRLISLINLKQPLAQLEIFKLRLKDELSRAGLAPGE